MYKQGVQGEDTHTRQDPGLPSALRREVVAIVPCYNAGDRLRPVLEHLRTLLDTVILVDDGSTDGAPEDVSGLGLTRVRFPENRGKGHALLAGFAKARELPDVAAIAVLDADGQHDPAELPRLYGAFRAEQADLVIGARVFTDAKVPWRSRFGNRVSAALMRRLLGPGLEDTQCGFRLLSIPFVDNVLQCVPGGRYETETAMLIAAVRGGYRMVSVPIATRYEAGNPTSHFRRLRDSWRVLRVIFRGMVHRNRTRPL